MADTLTRSRLRRLADLRPERGRVLSVYMDLDPSEFATPPARASLVTSLITDARHQVDALADISHDELKSLRNDVEAVREALTQPGIADEGARGAAVFACEPAGLLETIRLPYPISSRVVVDETPWVEPLLRARTERWCVLLANRRDARLFMGAPRDLEETDRVEDNVHSQHRQGGWSQPRYQRSIEEDVRDHLDHVAAVAFSALKARAFDRLLIGAPQETLGDLERRLHPYLRERLEGNVRLDVENATVEEVREAAGAAVEEIEVRREAESIERLRQGIGAGGRAAAGLEEVTGALDEARVATLLLADGYESTEESAGRVIEKALDSGADVLVIRHHDDLGPLGGIAALLRY
jgi:peptide chain release factor subunit 1